MKKIKFTEILTRSFGGYKLSNKDYAVCEAAMSKIYKNLPNRVEVEVANYYFPHSKRIVYRMKKCFTIPHHRYFNTEFNCYRNLYTAAGDCICSHLGISKSGQYNIWVKFKKL